MTKIGHFDQNAFFDQTKRSTKRDGDYLDLTF